MRGGLGNARSWLTLALVLASASAGASVLLPPPARAPGAPPDVFSAGRALDQVAAVAAAPHPAGSVRQRAVTELIAREMTTIGADVRIQFRRDRQTGLRLRNVVARIPGRASTGAVLVVAHADSVPWGPGAGDNATGVATLIELARVLRAGPRLRNDVVLLFEDGEELGYLGGRLFQREHPWMRQVKLAIGLDTAAWGIPFLIQDSDQNGVLVEGYARGVAHPLAFGLEAATSRNDAAEIDSFRRAGIASMEIEDTYANVVQHTAGDTVARVRPRSLQLMGDQVLGLTRVFGGMDLRRTHAPDRSFFTVPLAGLISYRAWINLAAALVAACLVAVGARRALLPARAALAGLGAAILLIIGCALAAKLGAAAYEALWPDPRAHPLDEYLLPSSHVFAIGAVLTGGFAFAFLYRRLEVRVRGLGWGFLAVWSLAALITAATVPAGAYLFAWPAMAAAVVAAARPSGGTALLAAAALAWFLAAPQVVLSYLGAGVAGLPDLALILGAAGGLTLAAIDRGTGKPIEP